MLALSQPSEHEYCRFTKDKGQINHLADAAAAFSIVANAAMPHDAEPHTLFGAAGPSSCNKPVQHPACGK